MGVTGLWRLIEPAGKPVPVETLENKVLAVDISIWLHQMVKGYQDAKGAPLPNAHLMGLFQRVCKLLYFRIKPVFVFDGGFPDLKKETIAKRQDSKLKYNSESERLKRELALILSKKTAVSSLLGKQISPKKSHSAADPNNDIFKLPELPQREEETESESEDEQDSSGSVIDLHSVDVESDNFKSLPVKEKYELLVELKETRKMNSWGRIHELPKRSDNFSDFQMQRLLKRRKVQECLEETEKEMGDTGMSLNDLESLLNEEGIDTKIDSLPTRRIASNNSTRFLLISNVKQALAEAKKKREAENSPSTSKMEEDSNQNTTVKEINPPKRDELDDDLEKAIKMSLATDDEIQPASTQKDELEDDLEKAIKMSLECCNEADTSACNSKTDDSWTSVMTESDHTDSEEEDGFEQTDLTTAKAYIMQYSDFTHNTINKIVANKIGGKKRNFKVPKVDQILDDLYKEKSIIEDNINLSSSDDDADVQFMPNSVNKNSNKQTRVELNTTENIEDVDTTQSSVVCIDNTVQDVITLDTTTEGDAKQIEEVNTIQSVKSEKAISFSDTTSGTALSESNTDDEEFEDVSEIRKEPVKTVCAKQIKEENTFPAVKSEKAISVTDTTSGMALSESSTDDDEFEDVPEIGMEPVKTVCEIMLTMDEPPEDDIFSDIFAHNKHVSTEIDYTKITIPVGITEKCESKTKHVFKVNENASTSKQCLREIQEMKRNEMVFNTKDIDYQQDALNKEVPKDTFQDKTQNNQVNTDVIKIAKNSVQDIVNIENGKSKQKICINKPEISKSTFDNAENIRKSVEHIVSNRRIDEPPKEPLTTETLNTMAEELQNEEQDLLQEKGRLDRIGRNITEQMTKEAQELLQIFGIPYIVAPMEAEAQCAFLESVKLTDGTITDDSDIWLFGGRTVYKNFFNQKKHVLQYLADRIERSFNLTREQLVLLALLVGSDYTTGVSGVGPVTALEILASFPFNKKKIVNEASKQAQYAQIVAGLQDFKKWVRTGKRTDNTTLKKKLKNVDLTDDFPSVRVIQAYMEPNIEKSEEKFTWGEMDITVLRDYTKAKFGWSQNKLDEIINPVIKRIVDRKSQKSVQDYFKKKIEFQSLEEQMSKRVKAAVQKMGPDQLLEEQSSTEDQAKTLSKGKGNKTKNNVPPTSSTKPGPKAKKIKSGDENVLNDLGVKVISESKDGKSSIEIKIPKSDRVQDIIPQREKEKHNLLQNKMKAIEIFRKTKMDRKRKPMKKKVNLPKDKAELSESSDSN